MKRLVKGLSSSRKGARQGFALALTGVLQHVPCWEPEQLTAFIASLSDISVGGSREDILGHLFALGAVVRSGIDLDVPMAASVAEQAIGLAHKKSFLREAAVELVIELCTNRSELSVAELVDSSPQLSAFLAAPCDKASPEALALAVRLSGRMSAEQRNACTHLPPGSPGFSAAVFNATNKKARSKSDAAAAAAFFTEQHMRQLVPVLRSSTQAHPRLNVVWPTLLVALVPGYATSTEGAAMVPVGQLQAFWSILVEEDIFKSASHERKFLAFSLFEELSRCLK